MRLDISDVLREVGKNLPYEIHEPALVDEDVECTQPIVGKVTFNNTGGTLLVRGAADTQVALECSRCAQYFERPVHIDVDEQFELKHQSMGPRTLQTVAIVEEDESPVAGKLFVGHVLDLTEMLRQYIILDQPTRPLPPELPDGRCAHCRRTAVEVLGQIAEADKPEVANTAFAKLNELLGARKPE